MIWVDCEYMHMKTRGLKYQMLALTAVQNVWLIWYTYLWPIASLPLMHTYKPNTRINEHTLTHAQVHTHMHAHTRKH